MVLASGSGSNFQAIIDAVEQKRIPAKIAGLIAGKPGIGAIKRAENHNIPVETIPRGTAGDSLSAFLTDVLNPWSPDLVVLAGFLKKIPSDVVDQYSGRMINIHPSLLPKYGGKGFYGFLVHQAVLEAGDSQSGCSVHYVNEKYDDGSIIEQREVPVKPGDTPSTLAERVLEEEHRLITDVVARLIQPET